jgi:hypothetical protein
VSKDNALRKLLVCTSTVIQKSVFTKVKPLEQVEKHQLIPDSV